MYWYYFNQSQKLYKYRSFYFSAVKLSAAQFKINFAKIHCTCVNFISKVFISKTSYMADRIDFEFLYVSINF